MNDGGRVRIMVAHGTRSPAGLEMVHALTAAVAGRVGPVQTAFVDVLGPNPADLLTAVARPAVVVPAFLASGYHVRTDLPARIAASGHRDTVVAATLGPDPELAAAMYDRLTQAGWRPGDTVVMAAAGSSDPVAQTQLVRAAALLRDLTGSAHLGFIATGTPTVSALVDQLRADGARRVFIAPYLLAHGIFHARLAGCGADGVGEPLGLHHRVVDLLAARFTAVPDTQLRTPKSTFRWTPSRYPRPVSRPLR